MMALRGGKFLGLAVDGSGRRVDDPFYLCRHGRFEDVERSGRQDIVGEPWVLGTLSYADCGLVKNDIDAFHDVADEFCIANITLHEGQFSGSSGGFEVLPPSSCEIVQDNDFVVSFDN